MNLISRKNAHIAVTAAIPKLIAPAVSTHRNLTVSSCAPPVADPSAPLKKNPEPIATTTSGIHCDKLNAAVIFPVAVELPAATVTNVQGTE